MVPDSIGLPALDAASRSAPWRVDHPPSTKPLVNVNVNLEVFDMDAPARRGQELHVLPTTAWGKWAVGFAVAFIVLLGVFLVLLATGPQGAATLAFTPQIIPGVLAAACAVAALITGLFATIYRQERSLLNFAATGIGVLVTVFVVGEFAIPPYD